MAFDPAFSQLSYGPELVAGVPADTVIDVDHATVGITDTPVTIPRTEILPGGQQPEPLPGGRTPAMVARIPNLHPDSAYAPFAWLIGRKADATEVIAASGHWLHTFSILESDFIYLPHFTGQMYSDNGNGIRALGCIVQSIAGSFGQGVELGMDLTAIPERADYHGDAVRTGTGTAKLYVRGIVDFNFPLASFATDVLSDLDFKMVSSTATEVVLKVRQGNVEAYGPDQTVTRNAWNWIHHGPTSIMLGDRADMIEVYVTAAGTIVADDVYHVARRRATPAKSTPDPAGVVVAAYSRMQVNDALFPVQTGNWTMNKTGAAAENEFGAGRQQTRTVPRGFLALSLTLNRRQRDVDLLAKLERNASISWQVDYFTRDTTWDPARFEADRISIICPNMIVSGTTPAITGPDEIAETVTLTAHPDGATPAITVEIVNGQETLPLLEAA